MEYWILAWLLNQWTKSSLISFLLFVHWFNNHAKIQYSIFNLLFHLVSPMFYQLDVHIRIQLFKSFNDFRKKTDAGEIVFEQGQMIMKSIDDLSTNLYDLLHLKKGKVKIGIPPLIGVLFFPKIIKGFKQLYPDVNIKLIEHY
jgi:hypothetical protein